MHQERTEKIMLPAAKSPIEIDVERLLWLLYGPPGIGKSTFLSKFMAPIFATTEPGHRHLNIFNRPIKDWEDFKVFNNKELTSPAAAKFKTVGVDTVPLLYDKCSDYVCKKKGWGHPSDLDFGKGYAAVNDEFKREMQILCSHGKGVVFIAHQKLVEVKARNMKYTKITPDLSGGCLAVLKPMVDVIAYAGFSDKNMTSRVLVTEPREDLDAKFRQDETKPPIPGTLPLSYPALIAAWNKSQQGSVAVAKPAVRPVAGAPIVRKTVSPAPVVRKVVQVVR